jgi:hypothetical protein
VIQTLIHFTFVFPFVVARPHDTLQQRSIFVVDCVVKVVLVIGFNVRNHVDPANTLLVHFFFRSFDRRRQAAAEMVVIGIAVLWSDREMIVG